MSTDCQEKHGAQQASVVDVPSQAYRRELALLEAAEYGQHQRVQRFLSAGGLDFDFVDSTGRAALHFAAKNGDDAVVKELITAGCDIDASSKTYGTALCLATRHGHTQVVQTLIDAGADVKAPGGGYGSALHAACAVGDSQLVNLFLERGTPKDIIRTTDIVVMREGEPLLTPFPNGQKFQYMQHQPIHVAASFGHVELVERFIDLGIDMGTPYRAWYAKEAFDSFENADKQYQFDKTTALHAACRRGHSRTVELLLQRGANADVAALTMSQKPLCFAAAGGDARCITLLINGGASVNDPASNDWTALCSAVYGSNHKAAEILLKQGAEVNREINSGATPISLVNDPEMAELLVKYGADVNYEPKTSITPLQFVTIRKQDGATILDKLIDLGAVVDKKSNMGLTALLYATSKKHKENALVLVRRGARPEEFPASVRARYIAELKDLIGDVSELKKKSKDGDKVSKSPGLFRRLFMNQTEGPSQTVVSTRKSDVTDDDEDTLCGLEVEKVCFKE